MKLKELVEKIEEAEKADREKITRDAFLYLAPKKHGDEFAQCATCQLYLPERERCGIIGPRVKIAEPKETSCGFYLPGEPTEDQPCEAVVSAQQAGLVRRAVRCENCFYGNDGRCELYAMLNKAKPNVFALDEKIDGRACCNAQTPK